MGDFQIELAFRKLILGLPKLEDFNIDGRMGGILNCEQNPGKKVIVQYGVLLGLCKFFLSAQFKSKVPNSIRKFGPKAVCKQILSTVQPDYTMPSGL